MCCGKLGLPRDPSHLGFLNNNPGQVISIRHSQGNSSLDTYNLPDRKVSDLKQVQNTQNNKHNEFAVFECFGCVFKSD